MIELQTTITAVAVYPDRARITRSGTVALEPGNHRLEVPELPLKLDAASVRASARTAARARLLGVDVRRDFYVETPAERVRELEQQIESLQDEMRGLDAQTKLLEQEHSTLGELAGQTAIYARGLAYGYIDAAAQMALLDGLRARTEELNAALLDLAVRRRDLERRVKKLHNELGQMRGAKGRELYTACVEIEVTQAGDLTVELTYVVAGAGWQPLYDMRLLETEEGGQPTLEIGYLAQVTQQTGEDWDAVALTLSTARPALAETLPELDPWYIRPILAPRPQPVARKMAKMAAPAPAAAVEDAMFTLAERKAAMTGADEVEAEVMMATVETSGAAVTYRVPGVTTVPADGAPHKDSRTGLCDRAQAGRGGLSAGEDRQRQSIHPSAWLGQPLRRRRVHRRYRTRTDRPQRRTGALPGDGRPGAGRAGTETAGGGQEIDRRPPPPALRLRDHIGEPATCRSEDHAPRPNPRAASRGHQGET